MSYLIFASTFFAVGMMAGVAWANRPTRPHAKCPWPMCGFRSLPNDPMAVCEGVKVSEKCPACDNWIVHNKLIGRSFNGYSRAAPLRFEA